jgi:hypothetical protein
LQPSQQLGLQWLTQIQKLLAITRHGQVLKACHPVVAAANRLVVVANRRNHHHSVAAVNHRTRAVEGGHRRHPLAVEGDHRRHPLAEEGIRRRRMVARSFLRGSPAASVVLPMPVSGFIRCHAAGKPGAKKTKLR